MSYLHGIYIEEKPTQVLSPILTDSAVQFIVGTAPINLLANPSSAVNQPILINNFTDAITKLGYSNDFEKFTLCQSMNASFRIFNVAPLVMVNVLDPELHIDSTIEELNSVVVNQIVIEKEGILLANFIVKSSDNLTTYILNTDYTLEFNDSGYCVVKITEGGGIDPIPAQISLTYNTLDPTLVTNQDIIGAYNASTGKYTGFENISQVYPRFGLVPGLTLAPGYSHIPEIAAAITNKTENINGNYKNNALLDVDTSTITTYSDVFQWKNDNNYTDKHNLVLWPMLQVNAKKYYYSAILAALIAYTDALNENVPYVSASNKSLRISSAVLQDGTEVYLDQVQANFLNGQGIITAVNINGWRSWGNNTGAYPNNTDIKDRFIPVRRMFDWWGNTFINSYFDLVDDPTNLRLVEILVDSENIRANGYKAKQQIAGARIEFNIDENPISDILNGKIKFKQYLTAFPPAEVIINELEFDPTQLAESLGGA